MLDICIRAAGEAVHEIAYIENLAYYVFLYLNCTILTDLFAVAAVAHPGVGDSTPAKMGHGPCFQRTVPKPLKNPREGPLKGLPTSGNCSMFNPFHVFMFSK